MDPVKRKYSSPARDEQTRQTRRRIVDAAGELFGQRGYGNTTATDIAARAGVSRDTFHALFGNKGGVLIELLHERLVHDEPSGDIRSSPAARAIKDAPDQRAQVQALGRLLAGNATRIRAVFEIIRTAPTVDPEMGPVFAAQEAERMAVMQTYAKWIAARGPLRVSIRKAGETIWTIASPDVSRMLRDDLGMSEAQHGRWLADAFERMLLRDA